MISEVRVKLVDPDPDPDTSQNDKLLAFCSITLSNSYVIRDLKIIGSSKGPFVAMPSRKLADKCPRCSSKNHLRARFCNECGTKLNPDRADRDFRGRCKLHADIAHPINADARLRMQDAVLVAYGAELDRARAEGYVATRFEDDYE